jgi:hypothetical protein
MYLHNPILLVVKVSLFLLLPEVLGYPATLHGCKIALPNRPSASSASISSADAKEKKASRLPEVALAVTLALLGMKIDSPSSFNATLLEFLLPLISLAVSVLSTPTAFLSTLPLDAATGAAP